MPERLPERLKATGKGCVEGEEGVTWNTMEIMLLRDIVLSV